MFGRGFPLFRLLGFQVRLDSSWLFLALLVAWSLASNLFPYYVPGLGAAAYWLMGIAGVIGLLFSIVIHEFCHSLVARRFGLPIGGISLFLFGGIAEMNDEPPGPKSEFLMAVAGPLSSFALAGLFGGLESVGGSQGWPLWLLGIFFYLAYLNLVLAVFNLLPAFPLDGGRMLRAGLWAWSRNMDTATQSAARIGRGFGAVLIILGIMSALNGFVVSGLWWIFIGMFLRFAANASYKQMLLRKRVSGRPVRDFMTRIAVVVPPAINVREMVERYVYKYHHKLYPVVQDEQLLGCIDTEQLRQVGRDEWDRRTVGELAGECENAVDVGADGADTLALMLRTGNSRLVVLEQGRLAGIVTLKDLVRQEGRV